MDLNLKIECVLTEGRSWREKARNVVKLVFKAWETVKAYVLMAELYARRWRPHEGDPALFNEELLVLELPAFGESSEDSDLSDDDGLLYVQEEEQFRPRTWLYFESRNYRNMLARRRSETND